MKKTTSNVKLNFDIDITSSIPDNIASKYFSDVLSGINYVPSYPQKSLQTEPESNIKHGSNIDKLQWPELLKDLTNNELHRAIIMDDYSIIKNINDPLITASLDINKEENRVSSGKSINNYIDNANGGKYSWIINSIGNVGSDLLTNFVSDKTGIPGEFFDAANLINSFREMNDSNVVTDADREGLFSEIVTTAMSSIGYRIHPLLGAFFSLISGAGKENFKEIKATSNLVDAYFEKYKTGIDRINGDYDDITNQAVSEFENGMSDTEVDRQSRNIINEIDRLINNPNINDADLEVATNLSKGLYSYFPELEGILEKIEWTPLDGTESLKKSIEAAKEQKRIDFYESMMELGINDMDNLGNLLPSIIEKKGELTEINDFYKVLTPVLEDKYARITDVFNEEIFTFGNDEIGRTIKVNPNVEEIFEKNGVVPSEIEGVRAPSAFNVLLDNLKERQGKEITESDFDFINTMVFGDVLQGFRDDIIGSKAMENTSHMWLDILGEYEKLFGQYTDEDWDNLNAVINEKMFGYKDEISKSRNKYDELLNEIIGYDENEEVTEYNTYQITDSNVNDVSVHKNTIDGKPIDSVYNEGVDYTVGASSNFGGMNLYENTLDGGDLQDIYTLYSSFLQSTLQNMLSEEDFSSVMSEFDRVAPEGIQEIGAQSRLAIMEALVNGVMQGGDVDEIMAGLGAIPEGDFENLGVNLNNITALIKSLMESGILDLEGVEAISEEPAWQQNEQPYETGTGYGSLYNTYDGTEPVTGPQLYMNEEIASIVSASTESIVAAIQNSLMMQMESGGLLNNEQSYGYEEDGEGGASVDMEALRQVALDAAAQLDVSVEAAEVANMVVNSFIVNLSAGIGRASSIAHYTAMAYIRTLQALFNATVINPPRIGSPGGGSGTEGNANGTVHSSSVFIAGERGPELVIGL